MFDNVKRLTRAQDSGAADAARIGDELREAREVLGLSLEDMAARLRIRRGYLQALEEGRLKELPSPAYAIGFVRNYAGALGLDVPEMVRRFRDVAKGQVARGADLVFPEPVPERGFPAGVTVLAGVAILLGAYVAWYSWGGTADRTVDVVPPVPSRLEPAARDGEALRGSSSPSATSGPASAPAAVAPSLGPASPVPTASLPAPAVQATPNLPPLPVPTPVPVQVPGLAPAALPPAVEPAIPPQPEGPRIVLRFKGDAWVQVRDTRAGGATLLSRVMRAGEVFPVPDREGLVMTTGAANNTEILVDGAVSPVLGNATGVRRDIALLPERLRPAANGTAAPR